MSDSISPPPPPPPPMAPYPGPPQRPSGGGISSIAIVAITLAASILVAGTGAGIFYLAAVRGHTTRQATTTPHASPSPKMQAPVTANSEVLAGGGRLVFSDDFKDASSGWTTNTLPSGTKFSYSSSGYVVVGKGTLHHYAFAPYELGLTQASVSITATQDSGAPAGAGFGVICTSGSGSAELDYEFLDLSPGTWFLEREIGANNTPDIITRGSAPAEPGTTPVTVVGVCATLSDGKTVRLILFVNGKSVVDVSDKPTAAITSWQSGMIFASREESSSTVTVSHFELRDLSS